MISDKKISYAINEAINRLLTESFNSSQIRQFFKEHGGVNKGYRNFSAGDITDEQIGFFKEFPSHNDAYDYLGKMKSPHWYNRIRSDHDMKYHFEILDANDGSTALVGIKRDSIDLGATWGGEHEKKVADRLNNNGWNFKTRDNRYVDDSDTYYYGGDGRRSPAQDFGMHTNRDYTSRLDYLEHHKDHPNYKKWREEEANHLRDYMRRIHGNSGRVPYRK